MPSQLLDAVVVGAGPNGLAAAITLARAGHSVRVLEQAGEVGGAVRSGEVTLPGFLHDLCSTVYPLAAASPFFRRLPLAGHGLEWIRSPACVAHPLDDGTAVLLHSSLHETEATLDACDRGAWRAVMEPLLGSWEALFHEILRPVLHVPQHPVVLARFGLQALLPARTAARALFRGERARALWAGLAAHSAVPLDWALSNSFSLVLALAGHAVGWPLVRGGATRLAHALAACLRSLGGEIATHSSVHTLGQLPQARTVLLDLTPRQVLRLAGSHLTTSCAARLGTFRYGPGAFKVDWALDGPIPWRAADCLQAATVHLGGTLDEICEAERAPWHGTVAERPFVLLVQPTLFDPSRAPAHRHTAWAYCHVPHACTDDVLDSIEAQVERFAPGFRDLVLARHVRGPLELESSNPNLVGGDVCGGACTPWQMLARPVLSATPYGTSDPRIFMCSASTPPGGGVHGMSGYLAARAALRTLRRLRDLAWNG